jgi:tetratricopeptide (TPR) repeat protein
MALEDCNEVLKREPSNLKALYRRSLAHEGLGNYSLGIDDLQILIGLDPSNVQAKKALVQQQSALDAQNKSRKVATENVNASSWNVESLKREALRLLQEGKTNDAIVNLKQALSMKVDPPLDNSVKISLSHLLASAYCGVEQFNETIDVLKSILELDANNFKALIKCGEISLKLVRHKLSAYIWDI